MVETWTLSSNTQSHLFCIIEFLISWLNFWFYFSVVFVLLSYFDSSIDKKFSVKRSSILFSILKGRLWTLECAFWNVIQGFHKSLCLASTSPNCTTYAYLMLIALRLLPCFHWLLISVTPCSSRLPWQRNQILSKLFTFLRSKPEAQSNSDQQNLRVYWAQLESH